MAVGTFAILLLSVSCSAFEAPFYPAWGHPYVHPPPTHWFPPVIPDARRVDLSSHYPQWNYFSGYDEYRTPVIATEDPYPLTSPRVLTTTTTTTAASTTWSQNPLLSIFGGVTTPLPNITRTSTSAIANKDDEEATTQSIFGLFNLVSFNHFTCSAGVGQNGSCYTVSECRSRGGTATTPCARGFGVCCFFNASCNQEITHNGTYFVNPSFPYGYSSEGSCLATIPKTDSNVCQLRLDLIDFDIRRPSSGDCNSDRLLITGHNANHLVPPICGFNSGQHIYVDIDMAQGPVQLNVLTSGSGTRLWNIKISKILCNSSNRAPANCLQYFTGVKGNFRSFNYDHMSFPSEEGYLNNLDYIICIRKEAGFCNIAYTNGDLPGQYQFALLNVDRFGMPLLPPDVSGAGIRDCPDDYINLNGTPLCGERLNADKILPNQSLDKPVIDSTPGQFLIRFHSNNAVVARGFNLTFQQQPCGAVTSQGR